MLSAGVGNHRINRSAMEVMWRLRKQIYWKIKNENQKEKQNKKCLKPARRRNLKNHSAAGASAAASRPRRAFMDLLPYSTTFAFIWTMSDAISLPRTIFLLRCPGCLGV